MSNEFQIFCTQLQGLTNAEALTEIFKKRETIFRRQKMFNRPDSEAEKMIVLLRELYENLNELNRGELFNKDNLL